MVETIGVITTVQTSCKWWANIFIRVYGANKDAIKGEKMLWRIWDLTQTENDNNWTLKPK